MSFSNQKNLLYGSKRLYELTEKKDLLTYALTDQLYSILEAPENRLQKVVVKTHQDLSIQSWIDTLYIGIERQENKKEEYLNELREGRDIKNKDIPEILDWFEKRNNPDDLYFVFLDTLLESIEVENKASVIGELSLIYKNKLYNELLSSIEKNQDINVYKEKISLIEKRRKKLLKTQRQDEEDLTEEIFQQVLSNKSNRFLSFLFTKKIKTEKLHFCLNNSARENLINFLVKRFSFEGNYQKNQSKANHLTQVLQAKVGKQPLWQSLYDKDINNKSLEALIGNTMTYSKSLKEAYEEFKKNPKKQNQNESSFLTTWLPISGAIGLIIYLLATKKKS